MITPDLEREIRDLLARLSMLSEAKASALEPRTSHGKSPSKPPPGVAEERPVISRVDCCPPEGRSLYDWFVWQLEHVPPDDTEKLEKLVRVGRVKHELRVVHAPKRTLLRAGTLDNPDSPRERQEAGVAWPSPIPLVGRAYGDDTDRVAPAQETEDAAAERVVEWYEGISALEVAVIENTTEVWVRKARKALGRNPDDGRVRAPFLEWDDAERRRQIGLLRARERMATGRELGAKALARHFGVDKNTIKPYLAPERAAA